LASDPVAFPTLIANLALELAPVRVNLIAAGFVDTPLSASILGDDLDKRRDELRASLPIRRVVLIPGILSRFTTRCAWPRTPPFWTWPPAAGVVRASSTSPVAVCDVIRDAGTFGFACHLILDERDCLVERRPARMGVTHRDVLEPDRHATEEDEPVRG
jgi:hypothetical protein